MRGGAGEAGETAAEAASAEVGEEGEAEALVELNFPPQSELRVLIDYVSQRLGMNILYDEQVGAKAVTLRAPRRVAVSSLLPILESALRMKGLALVDADVEGQEGEGGLKRVVAATNLVEVAGPVRGVGEEGEAGLAVVTRVFELEHASASEAEAAVRPFLTQPGGNAQALTEQGLLIVTDWAAGMGRLASLVRVVDRPRRALEVAFVDLEHLGAAEAASRVSQVEAARSQSAGAGAVSSLSVLAEERTGRLILIGEAERVAGARAVAAELDVPVDTQTRVYRFEAVSPERVDRLARELIGSQSSGVAGQGEGAYRSVVDAEGGLLIVTGPGWVQERVERLAASLDQPVAEAQSPVRFYKLLNADAAEVLETIAAIEGARGPRGLTDLAAPADVGVPGAAGSLGAEERPTNRLPTELAESRGIDRVLPLPLLQEDEEAVITPGEVAGGLVGSERRPGAVRTPDATVVADVNTNSLIVVAPPEVQAVYARLIEQLDRRRPQVLIETTVVTLDTSEGFSLGVEIGSREGISIGGEAADVLTFSQFGLSEVDVDTGSLTPTPGLGFNGAILSPGLADVVVRALATNARAQVVSAPRVLVNDNATGTIAAVAEQPFQSVNASDTVATTSFGGFVQAGTQISVTPHIAEGDHLRLEFAVDLSAFSGPAGGGGTLPPPRQTNSVVSEVTVPDGHTIIVGGVNRRDVTRAVAGIPLLHRIPILGNLFKSTDLTESRSTLFVFLRPTILRDDRFEDLRYLSAEDLEEAGLEGDWPESEPMLMR